MILRKLHKKFLHDCIDVVVSHGEISEIIVLGKSIDGYSYDDALITILLSEDKTSMEIVRKTTDECILWMEADKVIYFSDDFIYLSEHIEKILN